MSLFYVAFIGSIVCYLTGAVVGGFFLHRIGYKKGYQDGERLGKLEADLENVLKL